MSRVNVYMLDEFGDRRHDGWFDRRRCQEYEGATEWDGQNHVDINASPGRGQTLLRTSGGRWVIETWSRWVGEGIGYSWLTADQARGWLLRNDHDEAVEQWFGQLEEESGPPVVGRPEIGRPVQCRYPEALLAEIDAAAAAGGVGRPEWLRRAALAALDAGRNTTGAA